MKEFLIIDIGGTNLKIFTARTDGEKIKTKKSVFSSREISTPDRLTSFFKKHIYQDIAAIVVGLPGEFDYKKGKIIVSPNLPRLNGFKLIDSIKKFFNGPIFVENDVNLMGEGEIEKGYGKKFSNFILVAVGTGLGGAIIINGEVVKGAKGNAGEIGHILIQPDGELCGCGRRGCLEAYASGSGVSKTYNRLTGKEKISAEAIAERARNGEKAAIEAFETLGKYLGWGTANLVNTLEPQAVIFTGGLIHAWDLFYMKLKSAFKERAFTTQGRKTPFHKSRLKKPQFWGGIHLLKKEGIIPS